MKTHIRILTLATALSVGIFAASAADKHDHAHKATPKGGRLLDKTEPHAEFVVEKDRSVTINFYNEEMKPVAATTQKVTAIADAKSGKATLQFEKKGDSLVSNAKLPDGDGYNVVVQFKQTADAKPTADSSGLSKRLAGCVNINSSWTFRPHPNSLGHASPANSLRA